MAEVLEFEVWNVFTGAARAGNPLAIVHGADGLTTEAMQALAAQFNLSETVFVRSPKAGIADAALRIFTPGIEMPFAGHPTVGSAIALVARGMGKDGHIVLEEVAGLVPCSVRDDGNGSRAEFEAPGVPVVSDLDMSDDEAAAFVGLSPHEIGFKRYGVMAAGIGLPFVFIPVHDMDCVRRARPMPRMSEGRFTWNGAFVFCARTTSMTADFHARMFAPHHGIPEDPATGSAAVALAAVIMDREAPGEGRTDYRIEQGYEMGRPSDIDLGLIVKDGRLSSVRIGGGAVKVMEGRILA